jgi:hypothetical protein
MAKKKSKGLYSKVVIFIIIALNVWFTDRVLDTVAITGVEPAVLIGAFFTFTGGELLMLFGIKTKKIKKEESECSSQSENMEP